MQLKQANGVATAVEVNGEPFITSEEAVLFEHIENGQAYLYIKSSKDEKKEIKIKILKK